MEEISQNLFQEVLELLLPREIIQLEALNKRIKLKLERSGKFLCLNCMLPGFSSLIPKKPSYKEFKSACKSIYQKKYRLVSAGLDKCIKVWDLKLGKETRVLKGHTSDVLDVASTQELIVSGSYDKSLRVWNTTQISCLMHSSPVRAVAISQNSEYLVSGGSVLKVWHLPTNQVQALNGHNEDVWCTAIAPNNKFLVSGSKDKTLKVWNTLSSTETHTLQGHTCIVWCVAVSYNNEFIVSGSGDKTVRVWNSLSGVQTHLLEGHSRTVRSVVVTHENSFIVSGSGDKSIRVWSAKLGQAIKTFKGHTGSICSLAISCDDEFIVSGGWDRSIRVWNLSSGTNLFVYSTSSFSSLTL